MMLQRARVKLGEIRRICLASTTAEAASGRRAEARIWGSAGAIRGPRRQIVGVRGPSKRWDCLASTIAEVASRRRADARNWGSAGAWIRQTCLASTTAEAASRRQD